MVRVFPLVSGAVLLAVCAVVAAQSPISTCTAGRATFYDYATGGNGACGFQSFYGQAIFAPNTAWYNGSFSCGECVEVFGPLGSMILTVADQCPVVGNEQWCSGDMPHFDIDQRAFPTIGDKNWGVMLLNWRRVACPITAPVELVSKADSSTSWLSLLVRNHNTAIDKLEIQQQGSSTWNTVTRATYNQFEYTTGSLINFPIQVRVWNRYGDSITQQLDTPSAGTSVAMARNFAAVPTVPSSCAAPFRYTIYDEALNTADANHATAHDWNFGCASCTLDWASTIAPFSGSKHASATIPAWMEWWFATRGPVPVALSNFASVEIAMRAESGTLPAGTLQLFWQDYTSNILVNVPELTTTWKKFNFTTADFPAGSMPASLTRLALKNNRNQATSIYIDDFKIVPVQGVDESSFAPHSAAAPSMIGGGGEGAAPVLGPAGSEGIVQAPSLAARIALFMPFIAACSSLALFWL